MTEPPSTEGKLGRREGNLRGLLEPRPPRQGVELTDHSMCPPGTRKRLAVPSHTQASLTVFAKCQSQTWGRCGRYRLFQLVPSPPFPPLHILLSPIKISSVLTVSVCTQTGRGKKKKSHQGSGSSYANIFPRTQAAKTHRPDRLPPGRYLAPTLIKDGSRRTQSQFRHTHDLAPTPCQPPRTERVVMVTPALSGS